jgi:hypothetical protein
MSILVLKCNHQSLNGSEIIPLYERKYRDDADEDDGRWQLRERFSGFTFVSNYSLLCQIVVYIIHTGRTTIA